MKSTAHVAGHPIHPMLIPFPFALLSTGAAFDVASAVSGRSEWGRTAEHLTTVGLGTALVAAIPGIVDYFGSVPAGTPRQHATTHALCNLSAVGCFTIANRQRDNDGTLRRGALTWSLIGVGLLSIGGYLGGELVYRDRVGVPGVDERSRLSSRHDRDDDRTNDEPDDRRRDLRHDQGGDRGGPRWQDQTDDEQA